MLRSVLFIDPPAFCTTVEGLVAPALRTRPVAVAAPGADRATVLALSPEARAAGIVRGMPVHRARKVCPDLILLPPNPALYARASRALHQILRCFAPIIEPRGYGHAFLDLTGTGRLFGPAVDVAARIQREARARIRLPLSVGVAINKLVSQTASAVVKGTEGSSGLRAAGSPAPAPILQVPTGNEATFLAPHPIDLLPEVDPDVRERLDEYQLDLIGEVAALTERQICSVFGAEGRFLLAHARGIDPRPVLPPELKAEFRAVHTLATDTNDLGVLHPLLRRLSERVGRRLRQRQLVARRLTVSIAYADYARATRAVALTPLALDLELWEAARRAFGLVNRRTIAIRAVGVTVDRLIERNLQLELWTEAGGESESPGHPPAAPPLRSAALQHAIDHIHRRWGMKGALVGKASSDKRAQ